MISNASPGERVVMTVGKHMSEITTEAKWHSKKEIAAHFGIGLRTVTDWMRRRLIPFTKVGHVVRFNLSDCESAIRKYEVRSKE